MKLLDKITLFVDQPPLEGNEVYHPTEPFNFYVSDTPRKYPPGTTVTVSQMEGYYAVLNGRRTAFPRMINVCCDLV